MVAMLGVKYILFTYTRKQIHGFGTKCKPSLFLSLLETLNKHLSMNNVFIECLCIPKCSTLHNRSYNFFCVTIECLIYLQEDYI